MKLKNKKPALTLIELLVSITIMLIILAVSIPLFTNLQDKMLIRNQSQSVVSMVQYLRSLNNNPANESRNDDGVTPPVYSLVIDMTNSPHKIYIKDQKDKEFDTLKLTKYEELQVKFSGASNYYSGRKLVFEISGKTPNDKLKCPTGVTTGCTVGSTMTITIHSLRYSGIDKNITISSLEADILKVDTD